jgi:hypothetical protein
MIEIKFEKRCLSKGLLKFQHQLEKKSLIEVSILQHKQQNYCCPSCLQCKNTLQKTFDEILLI